MVFFDHIFKRLISVPVLFILLPVLCPVKTGCTISFSRPEPGDSGVQEFCGDGILNGNESCDGTDLGGETCETLGYLGGTLACDEECRFDTSRCIAAVCGNNIIEGDEVCDGTDLGGHTCESLGRGNGILSCLDDCSGFDFTWCQKGDGDPCSTTEEDVCAGGICFIEQAEGYPSGYCTRNCGGTNCPVGSVCVQHLTGHFCMAACLATEDCRPGYGCFDILGQGETYCWPQCENDDHCTDGALCNPWTGLCGDNVSGSDNGDACETSLNCKGSCTFWPQAPQEGYCVSRCAVSTSFCPGNSICSNVYENARGDLGLCLAGCEISEDCRSGFGCEPNPYGQGMICLPDG